jgi:hypothetical protein
MSQLGGMGLKPRIPHMVTYTFSSLAFTPRSVEWIAPVKYQGRQVDSGHLNCGMFAATIIAAPADAMAIVHTSTTHVNCLSPQN